MKINFIGNNINVIKILYQHKFFELDNIFLIQKKNYEEIRKKFTKRDKIHLVKDIYSLKKKIIKNRIKKQIFLIYESELIITKELLKLNKFFNIHRGSLYFNRGPIPEVWTILNGDRYTKLTLHQINHKIDLGKIIFEKKILLKKRYTVLRLRKKLLKFIPNLINKLQYYLQGKIIHKKISKGTYNGLLKEKHYRVDLNKDSKNIILNKIYSQKDSNGAFLIFKKKKYFFKNYKSFQKLKKNFNLKK